MVGIVMKKELFFLAVSFMSFRTTYTAAIRLALDFDTNVTFFLSNGSIKTFPVKHNTGGLFDSFVYDAFFSDGPNVGINKIRWEGNDESVYESILDMKPSDGIVALQITKNNTLVDPNPFALYRNKIIYKVPRS